MHESQPVLAGLVCAGIEATTPEAAGPSSGGPPRWSLPTPVLQPAPLRLPPRPVATGATCLLKPHILMPAQGQSPGRHYRVWHAFAGGVPVCIPSPIDHFMVHALMCFNSSFKIHNVSLPGTAANRVKALSQGTGCCWHGAPHRWFIM